MLYAAERDFLVFWLIFLVLESVVGTLLVEEIEGGL